MLEDVVEYENTAEGMRETRLDQILLNGVSFQPILRLRHPTALRAGLRQEFRVALLLLISASELLWIWQL